MKFVHISDLHIGKRLNEFSLEEDQRYILRQILDIIDAESPDAVLIAGDVYDNTTPGNESVNIFDEFLTELSKRECQTFISAGNHDSADKLSFGRRMFADRGIHISHVYDGTLERHTVSKGDEKVDVYMMPFIKPATARRYHPDEKIETYDDAVRVTIDSSGISDGKKVLVAHQFVTNGDFRPAVSDSETFSVGGLDNVSGSLFGMFDYVALGHLHVPQNVGEDRIRYCGSPLKYSKSESRADKSVTVVEMDDDVKVRTVPLKPLRDVRVVKGPLDGIIAAGKTDPDRDDYIYAELTDINPIDAMAKLREVYPNICAMETGRAERGGADLDADDTEKVDPMKLFSELYEHEMDRELTDGQRSIIEDLFEESGVMY